MKHNAIIVAGGRGLRMGGRVPKQYMELLGKPILYYSLKIFEESFIDDVILVCRKGEEDFCRAEFIDKYGFTKIRQIVPGGEERFHSVYNGLMASSACDYVYIHDGARPLLTSYILDRCRHYVEKYEAAVVASPARDTVKIEDGNGFIESTPTRSMVWLTETPQAFAFEMIKECYRKLIEDEARLKAAGVYVTDDTMVAKMFKGIDAKLVENKDSNIKITTPEDFVVAEALLKNRLNF